MRVSAAVYVTLGVCVALGFTVSDSASAQVPRAESQPSVAVPGREAVVERAPAPAPAAPAEPAPVTAAPAATSPVGAAPPAKASSSQAATASTIPTVTLTPIGATPIGPATLQPTSSSSPAAASAGTTSFFTGAYFALGLEGVPVAALESTEGGSATSEVVVEKPGAGNLSGKHLAATRYDDITFTTRLASKPLNDWIGASWKTDAPPRSGTVTSMDNSRNILGEREFNNAFITETTFPALVAQSKDDAHVTIKLASQYTRLKSGPGGKFPSLGPSSQKVWHRGGFRFEMTGLDGSKVSSIGSFMVRKTLVAHPVGESRESQQNPATIEFPNLEITVPASAAQTWVSWHDDFVVKGKNSPGDERSGAIVYLDPYSSSELGRINLSGCGIFKLTASQQEQKAIGNQHSVPVHFIVATLYCERMDFVGKP